MAGGTDPLRVAVVGLGPVGGTLAAHLIEAGASVVVCDSDREKIDTILSKGLRLENRIEKRVAVRQVCYAVKELQSYDLDLVSISVKTPYLEGVLNDLKEHLAENTGIMCAQNGIDNEYRAAQVFGAHRVLRMVINYAGGMAEPNVVQVSFFNPPNYLAPLTTGSRELAERVVGLLNAVGLETAIPEKIQQYVWEKAILNAALAPLCALTGCTMAAWMEFSGGRELVEGIIDESVRVARAEGVDLGNNFPSFALRYLSAGGPHRPSMLEDLENGRPTEIDHLNGRIMDYGLKHAIPTPLNQAITTLVRKLENPAESP